MSAIAAVRRTIDQPLIDAYADASGDRNPVHVDQAFAATTMFGGTIAHGMLVLALIGEMMYDAHGDSWLVGGKLKVRFKAPTRAGETVTASVTSTTETDDRVDYSLRCANERGELLIEGRASVAR